MSTCLSQIYNDSKRGILSGFAKLELFPIWNLGKESFVNLAYNSPTEMGVNCAKDAIIDEKLAEYSRKA